VGGTRGACFPGTTRVDAAARGNLGLIPPHPSRIAIKGHLPPTAIPTQEGAHRFQRSLFVELLSGLDPASKRSASIDKMADFDLYGLPSS
jgi:hypothetical protein